MNLKQFGKIVAAAYKSGQAKDGTPVYVGPERGHGGLMVPVKNVYVDEDGVLTITVDNEDWRDDESNS